MAIIDSDGLLELHVFGANQGESVVLKLPDGRWGVVDFYASKLDDLSGNATYQFLVSQSVSELEFLCLTHPHDDHYRGMSQLLDKFTVRYFWRPSAMSGQQLKWLLKLSLKDAERSGEERAVEDATELERIFTCVRESRESKSVPLIPKNASVGSLLYPVPFDLDAIFQVWAIAPSAEQTDQYQESLGKCFDSDMRLRDTLPYSRHNEISLALLVQYGNTRLILGGDVEKSGWLDSVKEFGLDNLNAVGVKVSHHGSTNGYCDGLWKGFSKDSKPIAVVTAFCRHGLPRLKALEHIRECSDRILTPCLGAILPKQAIPFSTRAPVKSRKFLHDAFKARYSSPFPAGKCTLIFDGHGKCIREIVEPPAGEIQLRKD